MLAVVAGLAAVWLLGWRMGVPPRRRLGLILALWLGLLAVLALRPELGARLGDLRVWLVLGGLVVLVAAYRAGLARLRARAAPVVVPEAEPAAVPFTQPELERYARHIMLHEIGGTGQRRLKEARVLIIGAGGLGSPAALYLAAAGVGVIGIIDDDLVESANLQRQIIHRHSMIGQPKVASAAQAMRAINPFIEVRALQQRLDPGAAALVAGYDLILDGSDNFATRMAANALAVGAGLPLISGALSPWEGQVALFNPARGGPCYACVFPEAPAGARSCSDLGVMAALPGVIGALMAAEAIKHITGAGQTLAGRMLLWDGLTAQSRSIDLRRRADCPVCGAICGGGPLVTCAARPPAS